MFAELGGISIADVGRPRGLMEIRSLVRTAQGLASVAGRRGVGYVGYLLSGGVWPHAAYRFGWGPGAPPILQGFFAAAGELAAGKTSTAELARLKLAAGDRPAVVVTHVSTGEVERLMNRAHAAGITGVSCSFGNLVRTTEGTLAFGDLTRARKHHPSSVYFIASRDADRQAFNQTFGQSLPTESTTRQSLRELDSRRSQHHAGSSSPTPWTGASRWRPGPCDFYDQRTIAPLIAGKRVLDLGSNNPSLPVAMLRAGAREVVAVEFMPSAAEVSEPNARILSWRDVHPYDTQVLSGDMRLFLSEDLGSFDVVTALCSLSFLPDADMARIIRKAASMNAVLILQANDEIDSLPAKTLDLHRLMRDNGYPEVQVHTREGVTQPLLVGFTWAGADIKTSASAESRLANH
jgi:hypothetical protein